MAKYFYSARDNTGSKVTGSEEAGSAEDMVSRLQARGLLVLSVILEEKGAALASTQATVKVKLHVKHNRVTSDDLVLFCRQIATLLGAGVTILRSLDIISQQVSSRRFYAVIKDLEKNMEAGLAFHEAMARHPRVFSDIWVNLVESGEASGNLAMVLNRLAGYLEKNASFKKKIVSALVYPAILLVAGTGALLFLTIKIIPTFAELFKGFNITLPLLTVILIKISEFIRSAFPIIIIGIIIGIFVLRKYISTKPGRRQYETLLFKLPLLGEFMRVVAIERFTSEMSTLVESGVPILYSLEIAEHSSGNLILADIIHKVKEEVRQGKTLSQPMAESGFFDPMAVQMVGIGEEIGELSNMFKRLNTFYQEYVETFLARFTAMFEPLMLILMGAVVGFMVIGMFLPIFKITQIR